MKKIYLVMETDPYSYSTVFGFYSDKGRADELRDFMIKNGCTDVEVVPCNIDNMPLICRIENGIRLRLFSGRLIEWDPHLLSKKNKAHYHGRLEVCLQMLSDGYNLE